MPAHRDHLFPVAAAKPDPVIEQAKRDLDGGQVDTDMHGLAGLDARRRARLVPGPGGSPPVLETAADPLDPLAPLVVAAPTVTIKVSRLQRCRYL